ncbi:MAG: hypothetical protein RL005_755 [Planctomycetota bacterium]
MRCTVLIVMLLCALPALAQDGELAGPIWGEGPEDNGSGGTKDAGATVETSQQVASPLAPASGSTLTRISGRTSLTSLVQADLVDLYEINITNPANFSAKTDGSSFDTVLFLFRRVIDNNGTPQAQPVAMNDDVSDIDIWSQLGGSTGALTGLNAGIHYLAVTKTGGVPIACMGEPSFAPLFTYTPGEKTVYYPSASQASRTLCDWISGGEGGDYQINLTGAVVSRSATCSSAIVLGPGIYSFSNVGVTSDSESRRIGLNESCNIGLWLASPNWFRLGSCDGTVNVTVCPTATSAEYGFIVYRGSCGDLEPVACGDQIVCTGKGIGAAATFAADPCEDYLVAFGPMTNLPAGAVTTSAGKITISCSPDAPGCGEAAAGSCFAPHSAPNCDSASCCAAVCAADPFCCNVQWDNFCVQGAYAICAPPPACPPNQPDLDGNGVIDGADLAILLSQWGT